MKVSIEKNLTRSLFLKSVERSEPGFTPLGGDMFIDRRRITNSDAVRRGGTKLNSTTQLDFRPFARRRVGRWVGASYKHVTPNGVKPRCE